MQYLAALLVWVAVFEGAAWIADAHWGYRDKLLQALSGLEPSPDPISAEEKLPWPPRGIMVRAARENQPDGETYAIGGRTIEDAFIQPKQTVLWPESFKSDERKRVVIAGGSSAFGYIVPYSDSFAGILSRALNQTHVFLNAAHVGWSSGMLIPVVQRAVTLFSPAVLVIYSGNNEWLRWVEPDQPWISQERLELYRTLAHSRTLAGVLYHSANRSLQHREEDARLRGPFTTHNDIDGYNYALNHPADPLVPYDLQRWRKAKTVFLDAFEQNLRQMVKSAQDNQVAVILMTISFNYRLSVAWKHPQPESMDPASRDEVKALIKEASGLMAKGEHQSAVDVLDQALSLDPLPAILHNLRGHCLEKLGRLSEAEGAYELARENMVGNMGSILSINERIRKVAASTGSHLLDLRKLFDRDEHGKGSCCNDHLIFDDCHPGARGHALIAKNLFELLKAMP